MTFYRSERFPGVALVKLGAAVKYVPLLSWVDDPDNPGDGFWGPTGEFEEEADPDWVRVRMVGDDVIHVVEADSITELDEDAFCIECGQIGCGHGGA
jgi:hypothetical protein